MVVLMFVSSQLILFKNEVLMFVENHFYFILDIPYDYLESMSVHFLNKNKTRDMFT